LSGGGNQILLEKPPLIAQWWLFFIVIIFPGGVMSSKSVEHPDHIAYFKFASKLRLTKSIQTLTGMSKGISIDKTINKDEMFFLVEWIKQHDDVRFKHPFNEIIPVIEAALSDGVFSEDEQEDLLWLCEKIAGENGWIDTVTADLQQLHGILAGIIADGKITESELQGLQDWLDDHEHLRTCWPYDEIDALIMVIMKDGKIDDTEHKQLMSFFSEFIDLQDDRTINSPLVKDGALLSGVCAVCPEISFPDSVFCVTGASHRYSRKEFDHLIKGLGAQTVKNVSGNVNYLVIGSEGNPCWMYSCYGRKVEKAVNLRKEGHNIMIVHENDFHDAVEDIR
jgi:hypothetical protein